MLERALLPNLSRFIFAAESVVAILALGGCGSKQSTGQAVTALGVAAVVVAVVAAPDGGGCSEVKGSLPGDREVRCRPSSDSKVARAALAGAGLGLTAIGNELQRTALDATSSSKRGAFSKPSEPAAAKTQVLVQSPCTSSAPRSVVFLATAGAAGAAAADSAATPPPCVSPPQR